MGSKSGPTDAQIRADVRKEAELKTLGAQEQKRIQAAGRQKRGRSSLISGNQRGIVENDNFRELNAANQPIADEKKRRLGAKKSSLLAAQNARIGAAAAGRKKDFETRDTIRDVFNPGQAVGRTLGIKW